MRVIDVYFEVTTKNVRTIVKKDFFENDDSLMFKFRCRKSRDIETDRDVINSIVNKLNNRDSEWFAFKNKLLFADLNLIKSIKGLEDLDWLEDSIEVVPHYKWLEKDVEVKIKVFKNDLDFMNKPRKIFLSHKTCDKPIVRDFKETLNSLNYECWFDEDEMPAGTVPHRGMRDGFKNSFAAVFFITKDFKDLGYLEKEIDFAINEKIKKGDEFNIITLIMDEIEQVEIPEPLKDYIYKQPKSHLEGLRNIIEALPKTD